MLQEDIHLITQLPQNAWFEGFVIRPNGYILVSRLDEPVLYTFDAEDREAEPQGVHAFPDATGLINLCPIPGRNDEYAVISGKPDIDAMQFNNKDYTVWRVTFTSETDVTVSKLADLDDYGFSIGIIPASEHTLLVADTFLNRICSLDIATGASSVLVEDVTMKAVDGAPFGLNRLRIAVGFVWFTNTSAGTLCRFPISIDGPKVTATGPVQVICDDVEHCDGLALAADASAAWTASMSNDWLWRIDLDRDGDMNGGGGGGDVVATTTVVKENLYSPTAVEPFYAGDRLKLYVVCNGDREEQQSWIKKTDTNPWPDFHNVTVTESVSVIVSKGE
ncbi:putative six-bladed beta-propellerlike protein [Diaporthe ampelina]|uniref:Putative six-bladed beta-propellerlike protein n=1 Tax=Diaporthe ampelina TaxID=1214573 RepID=A0A0G2FSF8_9PEZI|nr:putative six-bladed beta-propellerlike protein [Diaporthe ampelina]